MLKKSLSALLMGLVLLLVFAAGALAEASWETMTYPPEGISFTPLGEETDVYLIHKGDAAVSVRAQPKAGAKVAYTWRRFALRAEAYAQGETWHKVALPGGTGYVQAGLTEVLPADNRPMLKAYLGTAHLGYVYLAAKGETPLLMDLSQGEKHHLLLLPNDGEWQPVLLSLGAGEYGLKVYEAGLNDAPVRLLYETSFTAVSVPGDTVLALYSSLHTNMQANFVTVALAKSLCRNAETDLQKVTLLWDWLMAHASYDKALAKTIQFSEIPDSDAFIRGEKGICCDYAAFLAVGLRAVNVPCKHVYGKNLRTGNSHAWNEVYLDGKWVIIDATMAQSRGPKKFHTESSKNYGAETGIWDGFH